MLNLRKESPFRPPDWRWQKAKLLREQNRRVTRRRDDEWIATARTFQTEAARCRNDWDLLELAERYPALVDARSMYEQDGSQAFRWELEARLLSRDSADRIAHRLAISTDVVRAYEALFFNVQDRIDNRGYIVHAVLGRSIHAGLSERQFDLLWKMFGYFGGPPVLDVVVDTFADSGPASSSDKAKAWLEDDQRFSLSRKAAIAARTIPVNSYTQPQILEIAQKYYEIEKASSSGGSNVVIQMLNDVMTSLPWSVANGTVDNPLPVMSGQIDGFAAELRVDEILALPAGRTPDLATMSTLTFPEAPHVADRQTAQ